jgi:hypothetical protein
MNAQMRLMDTVDVLRRKQRELAENAEFDMAAARDDLVKMYAAMGETVDPAIIDKALQENMDRQFSFQAPRHGIGVTLAKAYINRKKILLGVGIPVLAVASAYEVGDMAIKAHKRAELRRAEQSVEQKIDGLYRTHNSAALDAQNIRTDPLIKELPGNVQATFNHDLDEAQAQLLETKPFFDAYAPKGNAERGVTQQNYAEADKLAPTVEKRIGTASTDLREAHGLLGEQQQLNKTKTTLDGLIGEIRTLNTPAAVLSAANTTYAAGIESVNNRQLAPAQQYAGTLASLRDDTKDLAALMSQPERLYASIESEAKEEKARTMGEELYTKAKAQLQAGNIAGLREDVQAMTSLDQTLRLEYEVVPTKALLHGEMKNGVDRREWKRDASGNRYETGNVNWYKFVKVINPATGAEVSIDIHNEECDVVDCGGHDHEMVSVYAERITPARLDAIKRDLQDNGLLDNPQHKIFARKSRGYITKECLYPEGCLGEITRW